MKLETCRSIQPGTKGYDSGVQCGVCLGRFHVWNAGSLECGHTFCHLCLIRLLKVAHRDSDRKVCPLCRQPLAGVSKTGLGHTLINIRQHIKCLDCSKKDVDKKEAFYCNDCIRTLCSDCSNKEQSPHQTHSVVPFSSEMALKLCMEYWKREQGRIEEATAKNQVIADKLKKFVQSDGFMDALLLKIKQFILRYLDDCFEEHLNDMKNENDRMARSFAFRASSLENFFGDLLLESDENQEIGVNDNENAKVSEDNLKGSKNDANKLVNELDGVEVSTDMDNKVIGEEKCEKLSESIMKLPEKLPDYHDDKILSSLYRNVLPFKDADVLTDDTYGMYHSSYVDPLLDVADKPLDCMIDVATSKLSSRLESDIRSMIRYTLLRHDFLDNMDWAVELDKFEERKKQAAAGTKADSIADSATTSEATTIGKQENGEVPGTDDAGDRQSGSPDSVSRLQQTDKSSVDDVSKADDGPVGTSALASVVNPPDDNKPPVPSESAGASQQDADQQGASGSENLVSSQTPNSEDPSDPFGGIEAPKMGSEDGGSEPPEHPPVVVGANHVPNEHDSDGSSGSGGTDSESTSDECQMGIFDMVDARNNSLRARVCAMDYNASMKQVVVAAGSQRFFVTPLAASALGRCIQMPKYQWATDPGDDVHFTSLATHGKNVFAFTPQGMVLSLIDSGTWTVRSAVRLTPRFEPINRMSATAAYLYILTQRELVRISVEAFKGLPPPSATEGPSTIEDAVVEVIFRSEGSDYATGSMGDGLFRDFCIVPTKRWILLSQSPYMSLTNNVDSSDDDNESDDGYYDVFGQANRVKHNKLHVINLVTLVLIQTHAEFYKSKNAYRNRTNRGQKLLVTANPSGKYVFLSGWWDYDQIRAYDFSGETPKPVGFLSYDEDTIVHMVCPTPTLLYCMEESEGHQDPAIAMIRLKPEGSESADGQDNPDGSANDTFLEYEPENKPSTSERIWE